ncbi:MAG: hypothetical protein IAE94_12790 [Chthoniobacterales bacterium]|nr:hypothetical protein [Chthoniobacterales bacterium]
MRVHPLIHFLWKNAIRLVLVLVFVGIPAGALYLREVGIGFGAKEALARSLSNPALEVSIGRLALDPFSGLLARDIAVHERGPDGRLLARISSLVLSLNLSELSRRRIVVDKISLRNTGVSIPVGSGKAAPRLDVQDVSAEVNLQGDQLRLSRFEGLVEGVRVELSGNFLNPSSLHIKSGEPAKAQGGTEGAKIFEKVLTELAALKFPSGPPTLRARLEADLAEPDSLRVEDFSLRTGILIGKGWRIEAGEVHGRYAEGVLRIPRVFFRDERGVFESSVEWSRKEGTLDGAILSTITPDPFLKLLAGKNEVLRDLTFSKPPQVEARLLVEGMNAHPQIRVTGMVLASKVLLKGTEFRDVGGQISWKDNLLYARDVRFRAGRGKFSGQLWVAPGDFRLNAKNSITPDSLLPLFDAKTREFLSKMEFDDLPDITVALHGTKPDFDNIRGRGHLRLGRTAMRGAWLDSAESDFEIGDRCVTYHDFLIKTGGGRGTGSFAYDVGRQEARLNNIRSTLVPVDVLMWIDPKIADAVRPYRFRAPPSATIEGKVHLKDPTKNNLAVRLEAAEGLDYDLLDRTLRFGRTSALVNVVGSKVHADVRKAALMGGDMALKAIVSIDSKDPSFGADVKLSRVNFARLTKLYFDYDDSKGVMSGNYKFQARLGEENLMRGSGSIRVEDGNVFAIPILGPFSEILRSILPGVGYETARLATADFTVANEIINTKNLVIEGLGFSMFGAGDIHFMTSRLDMSMRLNARGIPGIVFYPVSKLLEYVSTGTVNDPAWRPKIIPRFSPQAAPTPSPKRSKR